MGQVTSFRELVVRLRAGDEEAAAEIVRQYGPAIELAVRARLRGNRLRRLIDTMDVCQSVMGSFFVRMSSGQFELDTPAQLLGLLTTMAHRKLLRQARWHSARRRDFRRHAAIESPLDQLVDLKSLEAYQIVASRDLLAAFRACLDPRARYLADERSKGRSWQQLADELGSSAAALRIRLSRAVNEAARKMQLDEVGAREDGRWPTCNGLSDE